MVAHFLLQSVVRALGGSTVTHSHVPFPPRQSRYQSLSRIVACRQQSMWFRPLTARVNRIQALAVDGACLPTIDADIRNYTTPDTRKKRPPLANYNQLHYSDIVHNARISFILSVFNESITTNNSSAISLFWTPNECCC